MPYKIKIEYVDPHGGVVIEECSMYEEYELLVHLRQLGCIIVSEGMVFNGH